uniref:Golgin candidate 5 n=1 Tax=Panagrellus redivivus TaxID=6233 RepID=A0A7E4V241_PANRE
MRIAMLYFHCLFVTTILAIVASESSNLSESVIVAGIRKPDDFCYNNNCNDRAAAATEALSPNDPASRPVNTGYLATTIRPIIKSLSIAIRSPLPYPISHFDDTGVFVLLNLLLAIFVYVIIWLSPDSPTPHVLGRRVLHDALSRIKEQEVQIQRLLANVSNPAVIAQYTREIENLRSAKSTLTSQLHSVTAARQRIEAELAEANSERTTYQAELQSANCDKADLQNKYDAAASENASLKADLIFVQQQLEEATTRSADYIAELQDVQKTVRELEAVISEEIDAKTVLETAFDRLKETTTSLEKELEAKNHSNHEYADKIVNLYEQKEALERQIVASEEKLATSAGSGSTGSGESNASNGWDAFDSKPVNDTTEVVDKSDVKPKKPLKIALLGKKAATRKPSTPKEFSPEVENSMSIEAVMEMVALRDTVRDIKVERDNLKRELANVEAALEKKQGELEKTIATSDKCSAKNEKLEQLNADMYQKIARSNEQYEKIIELMDSISALKSENAASSTRVKDLEKQLKWTEERAENLDRKRYIDERKFKEKIAALEGHLAKAKIAQSIGNDAVSSGNSSIRGSSISNISSVDVLSLWDHVDEPEMSFDRSSYPSSRSSGSHRSSDRHLPPVEPTGRRNVSQRPESRSSTAQCQRSRSAGRQRCYPAAPADDEVPSGSDRRISFGDPRYDDYGRSGNSSASLTNRRI